MKKNSLEEVRKSLRATGSYSTPEKFLRPTPRKKSRWTTFSFSWSVFSVFPKCGLREFFHILDHEKWSLMCWQGAQKAEAYGAKVELDGWNTLADCGPAVILSNHMSTLETTLLPPVLLTYRPFNVIVKASLAHLPGLEKAAAHMGLLPITRTSPREDLKMMMTTGLDKIKSGNSVLIFPQGTRDSVFSSKRFSSIGAKLAQKAGVPVVPVAVKTDILPIRGTKGIFKDFGTVDPSKPIKMFCGPAISLPTAREMNDAAFNWIADKLESWNMPVER